MFSTAVFFAMKNTGQLEPDQTQKRSNFDQVTKDTTGSRKGSRKDTQSEQSSNQENRRLIRKSNDSTTNSGKNGSQKEQTRKVPLIIIKQQRIMRKRKPNLWDKIVDVITGKDDKNDKTKKQYKVTFNTEGGSELKSRKVEEGTLIWQPADTLSRELHFCQLVL